jgi:hypothetical protein
VNRIVKKAVDKIRKLQLDDPSDKERYFRGLEYSVRGAGGTPPKVVSPHQIVEWTSIPLKSQFDFWIVLDKRRAFSLLRSLGRSTSLASLQKILSPKNYRNKLDIKYKPAKVGNSLVFTYLEVLRIADDRVRSLGLPKKI